VSRGAREFDALVSPWCTKKIVAITILSHVEALWEPKGLIVASQHGPLQGYIKLTWPRF
jgi:hypothetical protein